MSLIYMKQLVRSTWHRSLQWMASSFSMYIKTFCLIIESVSQLKIYFNTVVKSFLNFKITFTKEKNVLNIKCCELK